MTATKGIWQALLISVLLFSTCKTDYKPEQLYGTWEITEINSRGNNIPILENRKCITFKTYKYYSCDSELPTGEWLLRGEILKLHASKIKDLKGRILYEGHNSEWKINKTEIWMVWRGTSKYHNQHLRIILKRKKGKNKLKLD